MAEASYVGKKLEGKVAIITGGASGIGKATAHLFAKEGARMVVIGDIQDELGESVAKSIGLDRCSYIHCDVTDENQVKSLVEATVKNYGPLDIMFANAGLFSKDQTIVEFDFEAMDRVFAVNIRGVAASLKYAARAMLEGGKGGSIVCTAGAGATRACPDREDYMMSKYAVLGLTKCASFELGKNGIRVNCVSPGAVATPLLLKGFGFTDEESAEKHFSQYPALKSLVLKANHIAEAVLFLASDQSAFVNGLNLAVDGGLYVG